jgi:hypothetical protein
VRDLVLAQPGELPPQVAQHLVRDLIPAELGQRPARYMVVHQQGGVGPEPQHIAQQRRAGSGPVDRERQECQLVDGPPHGHCLARKDLLAGPQLI